MKKRSVNWRHYYDETASNALYVRPPSGSFNEHHTKLPRSYEDGPKNNETNDIAQKSNIYSKNF